MTEELQRDAQVVMERLEILGGISEEPKQLTRRFATEPMRQTNETVAGWMRSAGLSVRRDNIGNLIGRYESHEGARTLLLGSHLDTVRNAGKYDGPLGVMVALMYVERLHRRNVRPPFAIEVLAFADEEGLRYHTAYLGSQVVAGTFDPAYLSRVDADGISMAEAIRAFGGDPERLESERRARTDVLGYLEVHIEQGPVLEAQGLPVGVVESIAGQSRFTVSFMGVAGHAGTVPMSLRHDALCAAAEFILAVESLARSEDGMVATVGQITAEPGASNVIPGHVTLSLDVRHPNDRIRQQATQQLAEAAQRMAVARGVTHTWDVVQESDSTACAPQLRDVLARAIGEAGYDVCPLVSGAGHDAVIMAELTDVAMLFVRCKGGISHNPAESVTTDDVAAALGVLERSIQLIAEHGALNDS